MEATDSVNQDTTGAALKYPEALNALANIDPYSALREEAQQALLDSVESVFESLEYGDEVHTNDGIKRIETKGDDAAMVGGIMFDKLQSSLNRPTATRSSLHSNEEVEKLA